MSDIFISYKREERAKARELAAVLERTGWTVWWDLELVGGVRFGDAIQAELDEARCVVVLWSKLSVQSDFVIDESDYAREQKKLLPARIDDAVLPLGFRRLHTIDLFGQGQPQVDGLETLVQHIAKRIGAPAGSGGTLKEASAERAVATKEIKPTASTLAAPEIHRDILSDGSAGPEMVAIPAGTFWMGSLESEVGRRSSEVRREVAIPSFLMGQYAITFAQYDAFCDATKRKKPNDKGWGRGDQPVISVSWNDAAAYAKWLSKETGKDYRLPTEEEWEYAARAGTTTAYWWGDSMEPERANYRDGDSEWSGKRPAPVGSFKSNPFGLYDTAGNVFEWTDSRYDGEGSGRVVRGGSWNDNAGDLRSAFRFRFDSDGANDLVGFRLARAN